ncbi:MAG: metal ABC transporter permease [Pseudomonadota bacterium]
MGIIELMAAPFAECMVLVGIHTYLGIHVLRRRVIFVDLALAQIAALGTMLGFLFGIMPESNAALIVSMALTLIGAAIFALTRMRGEKVPQEAIIGLVYAITAATAILIVEKTQGGEHLKDILVGSILWVTWNDVISATIAYSIIGVIHFIFRYQFFLISDDPEEAYARGYSVRAWDFFFYVTFGFVITFSTRVAGVLLVFVFLVAPAIMAFLITKRPWYQLLIGWAMGTIVTTLGLLLSYTVDLPSGPTVVAFYGITLAIGALVYYYAHSKIKLVALRSLALGTLGTLAIAAIFCLGATWLASTSLAKSEQWQQAEKETQRTASLVSEANRTKGTGRKCKQIYADLPDAEAKLHFIGHLMKQCKKGGLKFLLVFLSDIETPAFFRSEGISLLKEVTGQDFGYDPDLAPSENKGALEKIRLYLKALPSQKLTHSSNGNEECATNC